MDNDSLFNLATYKDNDIFSRWGDPRTSLITDSTARVRQLRSNVYFFVGEENRRTAKDNHQSTRTKYNTSFQV